MKNFFHSYRSFDDFEHLNRCLPQWLAEVADLRCHGTGYEAI
jgi:transposase